MPAIQYPLSAHRLTLGVSEEASLNQQGISTFIEVIERFHQTNPWNRWIA
jgi:hypothetical protein